MSGKQTAAARLRLRVTPAAEASLRSGHPWLFADSIRKQNRNGHPGELAVIYDRRDRFLAAGLFDPYSPIRVRVLLYSNPEEVDAEWWGGRMEAALQRRAGLFDEQNTGYRWINGESDGWPGLVLDRYGDTLVLKVYTAAWFPRLREIGDLILCRLKPKRLVLRWSRNVQTLAADYMHRAQRGSPRSDGRDPQEVRSPKSEVRTAGDSAGEESSTWLTTCAVLFGPPVYEPVVFLESGLRFQADVLRGQKTGFFLDQRENRREVGRLAAGRVVLNAFSFSGAFSLYAAAGGAQLVTDLDISAHALESSKRNFALNQSDPVITAAVHDSVRADAFQWLAENQMSRFGLIILDPPSLAKRESERAGAIRAYTKLADLAIGHLAPNGLLVACSCSAHVTSEEFFAAIRSSATRSRRRFTVLKTTGHAPDHPATFREAQYLKAVYLSFSPQPPA